MKILFLINDGYGIGGTIKTTFNLGAALAARGHDVEVLSTARRSDVPLMPVDPAIRLMSLVEIRKDHPDFDSTAVGRGEPTRVYPHSDYRAKDYDRYIEERYRQYLRGTDADVIIATRPGLIAYLAEFAPATAVRIGQEHLVRGQHRAALRKLMPRYLAKLDAFVTVSQRDAEDYRAHLRLGKTRLLHIPNSIPAPTVPASDGRAKLIVAAGRLVKAKRYDVLIRAFAKVVAERPDWQLRIYGHGELDAALRSLVLELGLHNHVRMMGAYSPIEPEWAKAALSASSADREPFGLTLVEAMRCGVPVVSTDAPHGPREILTDGVDGLLTPVGDPDALGAALLRVINDDQLRHSMATAALENSARYDPAPIAEQYEALFTDLAAAKTRRRWPWWPRRRPPQPAVLGPAPSVSLPTLDWDGVSALPAGVTWHPAGGGPAVDAPVPEGDWRLLGADGTVLQAGNRDTRHLLDAPTLDRLQLPYRRPDATMGVRVWDRGVRAEVDQVRADDASIHLTGRLIGAPFTDDATIVARAGDEVRDFPVRVDGRRFDVQVTALPVGTWKLGLSHGSPSSEVALGGPWDDIANKAKAYVLPAAVADGTTLQPGFLANNDFVIRVTA